MRVLYVIHSLPVGGAETLVVNYALKLKEAGVDICLVELYHTDSFLTKEIENSGIPFFSIQRRSGLIINALNKCLPFISLKTFNFYVERFCPDVIHYHTFFKYIDKVKFPLSKSVFSFHSRVERSFGIGSYVYPLADKLTRNGTTFVSISSLIHSDILHYFPQAHIVDIPNGVDLSLIRSFKRNKNNLCQELKIPEDSFIVGQVGRFNKVKNHIFTIRLFKEILKKNEKAQLVFVGTGTEKEIEAIQNEIKTIGIENNVHLMGLRSDAIAIMSCFDTLVLPSLSESFSLVIIEAQANNVRCVASDSIPYDVICNDNCFALSLDAPNCVWVETILGDSLRKEHVSLDKFDINIVVQQHIELYSSLIKK